MRTHHDRGEFDRLKDELRRLKRTGAPWYFESELHRRLHATGRRRARLSAFPGSTAFAITLVAIGCLAAAGYLMMVQAGLFSPRVQETAPPAHSAVADSVASPPPAATVARPRETPAPARTRTERPVRLVTASSDSVQSVKTDTARTKRDTTAVGHDTLNAPKSP
jgi:hypothetical protein